MPNDTSPQSPPRRRPPADAEDAQLTVTGVLKERSDVIVFTIPLALLKLVCIVPIPEEGTSVVPVYIKFRIER